MNIQHDIGWAIANFFLAGKIIVVLGIVALGAQAGRWWMLP